MPLFSHWEPLADISDQLSIPALVFAIVTPLFVIARFWSRLVYSSKLGPDDWLILASLVFAECVSVMMILVCEWSFGKHIALMPAPVTAKTLKIYFIAQIFYKVNIGLTKLSILFLYIRLFVQPWMKVACWTAIAIILAFTTGTVFSSIFQCSPVQYAFNKTIPGGGHCINLTIFWYCNAAFNILSDVFLVVLPIPVVFALQLPTRSKISLVAVFAVGLFVCVTSILRITTLDIATSAKDTTWNSIASSMWTVIESNLGIICACLPALRKPLSIFFPVLFGRFKTTAYGPEGKKSRKTNGIYDGSAGNSRAWSKGAPLGSHGGESTMLDDMRESQERIIDIKDEEIGIKKTTEVIVQVESPNARRTLF